MVEVNSALQGAIDYNIRMEPGVQTPEETLGKGLRILPRFGVVAGHPDAPPRASPRVLFPAI